MHGLGEIIMLRRLTVAALLQSVIALLAVCVVALLVTTAWQSWERLRATGHIASVAEASANAFKAMHNLRTDRSSTPRVLNGDAPVSPEIEKFLRGTVALDPVCRAGHPARQSEPATRQAGDAPDRSLGRDAQTEEGAAGGLV